MLSEANKARKKQEILESCFELFVEQGLENTSLNDLARHCGMYKSALYTYFKSKDDIVFETAKIYMERLDDIFREKFEHPKPTLTEALKRGFEVIGEQSNELRYVYQVVSSPKYGEKSRVALSEIYSKYLDYSEVFEKTYNIEYEQFRPYFLLYVATIHDYCLWANMKLVKEKLDFIYKRVVKLEKRGEESK